MLSVVAMLEGIPCSSSLYNEYISILPLSIVSYHDTKRKAYLDKVVNGRLERFFFISEELPWLSW